MKIKKSFAVFLVVFALLNCVLLFSDTFYVYKAIWHYTADIDDYKIFPNRIVKSGTKQEWEIGYDYNKINLPKSLNDELEKIKTIAFLIIKDDSIRFEKYWNGYSDTSQSNSFSIAKSIVSILTGIALSEGKINSLDDAVGNYLSEFKEGEKSQITIRHLLTMSSGLNFQEAYLSPISHTTEAYYGSDLKKLIRKLKVIKKPGTEFSYKSGDTEILAMVLESATGMSLSQYASKKLWKPIGASRDALWSLDKKDGMEKAFCCFNSNARDFAKIGKLYLQNGNWNEKQIVPENFVRQSLQPVMLKDTDGQAVDYYGYLWWLLQYKGNNIFYARGILGQYLIVIPEKNIIIVRLGKSRGEKIGNHYHETYSMIDVAMEMFN